MYSEYLYRRHKLHHLMNSAMLAFPQVHRFAVNNYFNLHKYCCCCELSSTFLLNDPTLFSWTWMNVWPLHLTHLHDCLHEHLPTVLGFLFTFSFLLLCLLEMLWEPLEKDRMSKPKKKKHSNLLTQQTVRCQQVVMIRFPPTLLCSKWTALQKLQNCLQWGCRSFLKPV